MRHAERDFLLGYLAHFQSAQRAFYGGILVTDARGVPKEFRHSDGIRPTRMQITLYGDSLEASIGADALAPALYAALALKPDILLIDTSSRAVFGSFVHAHSPAALLVALNDPDLALADRLAVEGSLLDARDYDLKGSTAERVYAYIEEGSSEERGATVLEAAHRTMNLVSPFDRVRTVLAEIAQVDPGRPQEPPSVRLRTQAEIAGAQHGRTG
ncbi:MAG: hypothetical protein IT208_05480 [Chthonomonadales bacterium]|nr:hypothetical protein [Chthonomonadales bacterium]